MILSGFLIDNKAFAAAIIVAVGFFVLTSGVVLYGAAKSNSETAAKFAPAAKRSIAYDYLDSDIDALPDRLEMMLGTDAKESDTDKDGYDDGEEIKNGYDPSSLVFGEKYALNEFEKVKTDIQDFDQEIYDDFFNKEGKSGEFIQTSPVPAVSSTASSPVLVLPTPTPMISVSPVPVPEISPIPGILKEKNINKDWSYIIYIPSDFDKDREYPLVLVFSGSGSAISDTIDNWRGEADKNGFIVAALLPYEKKYPSGNVVESYPWNEASAFAASAVKNIKKEHKVDEKNIFLEGYSTGAATAYIVALEGGIKFKGVITIGGYLPLEAGIIEKLINSNGLNFYVIHGANENEVETIISQEKTLLQYGAKMFFVTLEDAALSEYSTEARNGIAEWINGLR